MSPSWIRRRDHAPSTRTPKGKRSYQVLYRRGGRGYRIETAGSFPTEREAKTRRDLVAGWLAAGHDPRAELAKLTAVAPVRRTYAVVAEAYVASRVDAAAHTATNTQSHLKKLLPLVGMKAPEDITVDDCIDIVASLSTTLKPGSVKRYFTTHRMILDFARVRPNPARDATVKLPQIVREEPSPPSGVHVLAFLDKTPKRWRLPLVTLEQTAMAVGEAHSLEWGDVDVPGCRFRLRQSEVKAQIRSRARWVQVPDWLMALIDETCPVDDRSEQRRVFPGFTPDVAKNVMARACRAAGIPHYHPHDLRHRRVSLWHGQGIPAAQLAARAGHSRPSMSLDVYSHVMPLDEAPIVSLKQLLVRTP